MEKSKEKEMITYWPTCWHFRCPMTNLTSDTCCTSHQQSVKGVDWCGGDKRFPTWLRWEERGEREMHPVLFTTLSLQSHRKTGASIGGGDGRPHCKKGHLKTVLDLALLDSVNIKSQISTAGCLGSSLNALRVMAGCQSPPLISALVWRRDGEAEIRLATLQFFNFETLLNLSPQPPGKNQGGSKRANNRAMAL